MPEGGRKVKARLVLHGNQESGEIRTDSTTPMKQSLRLGYFIARQYGWVKTRDVTAAFLQSHIMDRKVVVKPPDGVEKPGVGWLMLKLGYGINDASRRWYNTIAKFLVEAVSYTHLTLPTILLV